MCVFVTPNMAGMQMATFFNNIFKEIAKECATHLCTEGKSVTVQDVEVCISKFFTETCFVANDKVIHAPKPYKMCSYTSEDKDGNMRGCKKNAKHGEDMCTQHKAQQERKKQKESAGKCAFTNGDSHCGNNAKVGTSFCAKHAKSAAAKKEKLKMIDESQSDSSDE